MEELLTKKEGAPARVNAIESIDVGTLSIADAISEGSVSAQHVFVEFTDYQCPFCAKYSAETHELLKSEFVDTGKVRYISMNLPLPMHFDALRASEAAECANLQGRYSQMRSRLFRNPNALRESDLLNYAGDERLRVDEFRSCLRGQMMTKIKDQIARANAIGVKNTPTFLLGRLDGPASVRVTHKVTGAQSIETFRTAIAQALER